MLTPAYILGVIVLVLAGLYVNGFKLLDVQSDSMKPTISKGDTVLVDTNEKQYNLGQVVAYRSLIDKNILITHRLIDEYQDGKLVSTQGDALAIRDPKMPSSQIEGRVIVVIPMLGRVTAPFKNTYVVTTVIYALAIVIIAQEIRRTRESLGAVNYRLKRYERAM